MTTPAKEPRDRDAEKTSAKNSRARRVTEIVAARHEGRLGDEHIKLAQAMILCTLPYSEQKERQITRKARLGDGSYLNVTFTAARAGVPIPWGADRKLLAWIFDRAIQAQSSYISWESANEYLREMGLSLGGKNNRLLYERFRRISGLVINIERRGQNEDLNTTFPIIEKSRLPSSVTGRQIEAGQQSLPEMHDRFGFTLNAMLWDDIRHHRVALPREIWRDLKGPSQVQDIVFWLLFRCYSARSESVIPWSALPEQFASDSNPWRLRSYAREAIKLVNVMWPQVRLAEVPNGIWVDVASEPLMQDDRQKGRIRKL